MINGKTVLLVVGLCAWSAEAAVLVNFETLGTFAVEVRSGGYSGDLNPCLSAGNSVTPGPGVDLSACSMSFDFAANGTLTITAESDYPWSYWFMNMQFFGLPAPVPPDLLYKFRFFGFSEPPLGDKSISFTTLVNQTAFGIGIYTPVAPGRFVQVQAQTAIPEPSTFLLAGLALLLCVIRYFQCCLQGH